MGSRGVEIDGQSTADGTPEDVAVLYSWANLQGAKYRDYSASRREYRAQARYRAAKALLERELLAQAEAEASAKAAEREALAAEATARSQDAGFNRASRVALLRSAEVAARKAAADRVEAARRSEAAAHANLLALREEREMAEAHVSARMQALIYTESEARRRERAGPQPGMPIEDIHANATPTASDEPEKADPSFSRSKEIANADSEADLAGTSFLSLDLSREKALFDAHVGRMGSIWPLGNVEEGDLPLPGHELEAGVEHEVPAWLHASRAAQEESTVAAPAPAESLMDSRERVASRWLALGEVFESAAQPLPTVQPAATESVYMPLLAVYSLAGGVGKTSLVATLGRALSQQGEKVVLADTTSQGLLPYYFGGRELRPGVVDSFPPLEESAGEPISLVMYPAAGRSGDEQLKDEILRNCDGNHRVLLDLASDTSWLVRQLADQHPTVLVPIAPDMNSVISLQSIERVFRSITDSEGRSILPFYVLNQFDASLPLHLDVREVLRHRLGDRLLPVAIRHSPAVSEALAQGMTVVDYAPTAPVSQDYLDVASWLRAISPASMAESRSLLWGEQ